jgi:hypothetical protein
MKPATMNSNAKGNKPVKLLHKIKDSKANNRSYIFSAKLADDANCYETEYFFLF